jgi:hypothetical protein
VSSVDDPERHDASELLLLDSDVDKQQQQQQDYKNMEDGNIAYGMLDAKKVAAKAEGMGIIRNIF